MAFPFVVHHSGDYDVLLPISEGKLLHFIFHTSETHTLAIHFIDGKLAFLLLCTLLKMHALAIYFLDCELAFLYYALF